MREQLITEKQANEATINECRATMQNIKEVSDHAIFEQKINISRLEKANREIDKTLELLK